MQADVARSLWLQELQLRSCSPATLRTYQQHLGEALKSIALHEGVAESGMTLEHITRDSIISMLSEYRTRTDGRNGTKTTRSPASVRQRLGTIKSFLTWCVLTEKITRNNAMSVRAPKIPQRVPKALDVQTCAEIIDAAQRTRWPQRDRLMALAGFTMGLRLAEITSITLGALTPAPETATHLTIVGKGSKERVVPVTKVFREALGEYLPTRTSLLEAHGTDTDKLFLSRRPTMRSGEVDLDITVDGVGQVYERILTLADKKSKGARCHVSRHSWAASAVSSKVFDLEETRRLLGHSSIATTQIYLSTNIDTMSSAAETHPLSNLPRAGAGPQ